MAITRVTVSCYNLLVEIESEHQYPDQLSDLAHRARELFGEAVTVAKEQGIDIYNLDIEEEEITAEEDRD